MCSDSHLDTAVTLSNNSTLPVERLPSMNFMGRNQSGNGGYHGHSYGSRNPFMQADQPNWPELMSKTVGDLSHIAKTEIELLEASLRRLIESEAYRILGILLLLIASLYGLLLLLGGVVVLLHAWVAWWLALVVTGAATVAAGLLIKLATGRTNIV